jgi:hypothetical protein
MDAGKSNGGNQSNVQKHGPSNVLAYIASTGSKLKYMKNQCEQPNWLAMCLLRDIVEVQLWRANRIPF